jgi:fructose-1,6-bisphosphatase/inositol monophosphatase family enzyme
MGPCVKLSSLILRPRKFRFISDCVQHALVAQGRIDAAIDPEMNPWDIAALIPCVEEAGGVISRCSRTSHLAIQSAEQFYTCASRADSAGAAGSFDLTCRREN